MALLLIAGMAVLLHAAIPVGFMPDIGKQAGSFVTICSGFGEKTVFIAGTQSEHQGNGGGECVYGFTLPALDQIPSVNLAIIAASFVTTSIATFSADANIHRLDLSHPPTGPPVLI
jgi:hypothetical protein